MTAPARPAGWRLGAQAVVPFLGLLDASAGAISRLVSRRRVFVLLSAGVLLLAFYLRLRAIEEANVWWDEGFSVLMARESLHDMALRTAADVHPPLHYAFLHFWRSAAGESMLALRFSSVAFAMLTVALVLSLGARYLGRPAGLLAGLMLAVSRFDVWWSQEIRMYALAVLLVLLSLHFFLEGLRGRRWRDWALYALFTLAAIYTVYMAFAVIVVEALLLLTWRGRSLLADGRRLLAGWCLSLAAVALGYIPWVYLVVTRSTRFEKAQDFSVGLFAQLYLVVLPTGISTDLGRHLALGGAYLALAVVAALLGWRLLPRGARPLLLAGVLAYLALPVGVYLLSLPRSAFFGPRVEARYVILFLPLYVLLLAASAQTTARLWRPLGLGLAALAVLGFSWSLPGYYRARHATEDLAAMARLVEVSRQQGDVELLDNDRSWTVFNTYLHGLPLVNVPSLLKMDDDVAAHYLRPVDQYEAVWHVRNADATTTDPGGVSERWLQERFHVGGTFSFGDVSLALYSREENRSLGAVVPERVRPQHAIGQDFGALRLLGFDLFGKALRSGDNIYVFSYWRGPTDGWEAALALAGGSKGSVTGRWQALPGVGEGYVALLPQSLTVGPGVKSGDYGLYLRLRHEGGEERSIRLKGLSVRQERGPEADERDFSAAGFTLAGEIRLSGYALDGAEWRPGGQLTLSLRWEALASVEEDYKVFVHIVNSTGDIVAQVDRLPGEGRYRTPGWNAGDVIVEEYQLLLPDDCPPGSYAILAGMYDSKTMKRAPMADAQGTPVADGAARLAEVTVR